MTMINELVNNGFQPRKSPPTVAVGSSVAVAVSPATVELQEAPPAQPTAPDTDQLQSAVSKLNDFVQSYQRKLSFSVSAETGRTIITVYDAETDELIRQIPPEETLKLAELIDDNIEGFFVKERA
jgi:flagellar protein FlaG